MLVEHGVEWRNGTARPKDEISITASHSLVKVGKLAKQEIAEEKHRRT
jgi:hypothetical protein